MYYIQKELYCFILTFPSLKLLKVELYTAFYLCFLSRDARTMFLGSLLQVYFDRVLVNCVFACNMLVSHLFSQSSSFSSKVLLFPLGEASTQKSRVWLCVVKSILGVTLVLHRHTPAADTYMVKLSYATDFLLRYTHGRALQ